MLVIFLHTDSITEFIMYDVGGNFVTNSRDNTPEIIVAAGDIVQYICVYDPTECGPYQRVDWDVGGVSLTDTEGPGTYGAISGIGSVVQTVVIDPTMSGQELTCQFPDGSVKRSVLITLLGKSISAHVFPFPYVVFCNYPLLPFGPQQ